MAISYYENKETGRAADAPTPVQTQNSAEIMNYILAGQTIPTGRSGYENEGLPPDPEQDAGTEESFGAPGMNEGLTAGTVPGMRPGTPDDRQTPMNPNGIYGNIDLIGQYNSIAVSNPTSYMGQTQEAKDFVARAMKLFSDYKGYKALLDARIVENEEWYRMQHWQQFARADNGKYCKINKKRNTGWLFNSIDNKHADFMDNYPDVSVKPRERNDETAAKQLSAILPVVLKRNRFKNVYSDVVTDKLKNGTGIFRVYWDGRKENGIGDVAIDRIDPLNIFWESGISNIQDSSAVFIAELVDNDTIAAENPQFPDIRSHLSSATMNIARYLNNSNIDTSDKSYVIHMYYKVQNGNRKVLHFAKMVNDLLLFSSEATPGYEDGWYAHGLYPVVFDTLYKEPGTPFGFGLIDANRDTQEDIDEINALMLRNVKQAARLRYFFQTGAGVNEEEFVDLDKDIVHVQGAIDERVISEIKNSGMDPRVLEVLNHKIEELKEISSNRDVTAGGTGGSVTAASAIAALQETGNKTSRAMVSKTYGAFEELCEQIIELIRQFYDIPRAFRVTGDQGEDEYMNFSNAMMKGGREETAFGVNFKDAQPVFDVDVLTYKQNPFSKAAQNQDAISFYQMGFFNPDNDVPSLACMEMLDFEGKDKVKDIIKKNGQTNQILTQVLPMCINALAAQDPAAAAQIAGMLGIQAPLGPMPGAAQEEEAQEDQTKKTVAKTDSTGQVNGKEHAYVERARERARANTGARA